MRLGLTHTELGMIEQNYQGDTARCKQKMFGQWLHNAEDPTWEIVADALFQMGERAVGLKIQKKYCITSTGTGMFLIYKS